MKSENQIIVRCKQPIKIEKPFQSLLTFPYIAGGKKYSSDRFVVIFSVFILSMPSKVIICNSNRVYVLGHKYILGPSQSSF